MYVGNVKLNPETASYVHLCASVRATAGSPMPSDMHSLSVDYYKIDFRNVSSCARGWAGAQQVLQSSTGPIRPTRHQSVICALLTRTAEPPDRFVGSQETQNLGAINTRGVDLAPQSIGGFGLETIGLGASPETRLQLQWSAATGTYEVSTSAWKTIFRLTNTVGSSDWRGISGLCPKWKGTTPRLRPQ